MAKSKLSKLLSLLLVTILMTQSINIEMVYAQAELISETLDEVIQEIAGSDDAADIMQDEDSVEEIKDLEEEIDAKDNESLPTDETEEITGQSGNEENGELEAEENLVVIEPLPESTYIEYTLDTSGFSPEVMSVLSSGDYTSLSEEEKDMLRMGIGVREDTMKECAGYGYDLTDSIPIAIIMQQLNISLADTHSMITNLGSLGAAAKEAEEFRLFSIENAHLFNDTEIVERLVRLLVQGYTSKEAISIYTMSIVLDIDLEGIATKNTYSSSDLIIPDEREEELKINDIIQEPENESVPADETEPNENPDENENIAETEVTEPVSPEEPEPENEQNEVGGNEEDNNGMGGNEPYGQADKRNRRFRPI